MTENMTCREASASRNTLICYSIALVLIVFYWSYAVPISYCHSLLEWSWILTIQDIKRSRTVVNVLNIDMLPPGYIVS